jgi:hypothetical protein
MALDPATIKAILTVAQKVLTDKELKKKILIALSIPLILVLVVLSSPFAILFGTSQAEGAETETPIIETMNELYTELLNKIEYEKNSEDADEVNVVYMGSEGEEINNSGHVLALFSIDNNMLETEEAAQVAVLSEEQVEELKKLYWEMNYIEAEILEIPWDDENYPLPIPTPTPEITPTPDPEVTPYPSDDYQTPTATPTPEPYIIKNIYITCLSYQDVLDDFEFTDNQLMVLEDMMSGEYAALFSSSGGNTAMLSDKQISNILSKLPTDINLYAANIPMVAKSLIGRVSYFWGGKYNEIGMCPEWGTLKTVTSPGSTTTGTQRPYGLDCSGYVAWVFINSGISKDLISEYFGIGTNKQWEYSVPISTFSTHVGDLAFKSVPGTEVNHVGVVVGFDSDGKPLVAHCSSGNHGIAVTPFAPTFKYLRRPVLLLKEEGG